MEHDVSDEVARIMRRYRGSKFLKDHAKYLGVGKTTVHNWESNRATPSEEVLIVWRARPELADLIGEIEEAKRREWEA